MSNQSFSWRHLLLASLSFLITGPLFAQAFVQIVNASPDLKHWKVDVYVNGNLLVDDLEYTKATPYLLVPARRNNEIAIAPSGSVSVDDALAIRSQYFTIAQHYYAVIHGVTDPENYPVNPDGRATGLDITFDSDASKTAPDGEFRILNFHAVPDGPATDAWLDYPEEDYQLGQNHRYGFFGGVVGADAAQSSHLYLTATGTKWPRLVDLKPVYFSSIEGTQVLELSVGFASNVSWRRQLRWIWVHPDGTTEFKEINSRPAPVQFIVASPDAKLDLVDIWVDGFKIADNVRYGKCTPLIELTAGMPVSLAVTEAHATNLNAPLFREEITFNSRMTYQAVIAGVLDPAAYPPNPEGRDISLDVFLDDQLPTFAPSGQMTERMFNGVVDFPSLDFRVGFDLELLAHENVGFGEFSGKITGGTGSFPVAYAPTGSTDPIVVYQSDTEALSAKSVLSVVMGVKNSFRTIMYDVIGLELVAPLTTASESLDDMPTQVRLVGNYPNPFNPSTQIEIDLPAAVQVRLDIFDVLGRRVSTLHDGLMTAGRQRVTWQPDASVPGGVYLYSLTTPSGHIARPMTYIK